MNRNLPSFVLRTSCFVLACAALAAHAGVKYWDNPGFRAYDVGDYVQDGLVVNYDGIRNAGPDAPHDSSAMTWVNCADPGTYDMERHSTNGTKDNSNQATAAAWNEDDSHGAWTDMGFLFDKQSAFHQPTSITIPASYSMQVLLDAKTSDQNGIGYVMCGENTTKWQYASLALRNNNTIANTFYFNAMNAAAGSRPAISGGTYAYGTAILDKTNAVLFAGIKAPWNAAATGGTTGHYRNGSYTPAATELPKGFSLGGHYPRTDEMFKGTLKSYRLYNRRLTDTEILWNRVVDEARYFGRKLEISVIPVTNVVESSTIPGVRDYHYAIDAEGQTFTAPAQRTVDGKRYTLSGYTLETWDGSAWGASVAHDGESSYTATDPTALVRLTWQYAAAAGEGKLKIYDVDDYVQDDLALHFDGIRNAGASADHDPNATTWANLGSETGYDLSLIRTYGSTTDNDSAWGDDGFDFAGGSRFNNGTARTWGPSYTIQTLVDADVASQKHATSANYIFGTGWAKCAIGIYRDYAGVCLHTQEASAKPYGPYTTGATSVDYTTAVLDGTNLRASITDGTTIPTDGSKTTCTEYTSVASYSNGMNLGGWGGALDQYFIGRLKNFRVYTRVLTEAELAHNRRVDNYRFFGIYERENPNVTVQSTYAYLEGFDPSGDYEVEGSYTFVAPATNTAPNGIAYACDGYVVEKKSGQVGWVVVAEGTGNSYRYETSAGTVRLTWKWKATHGLRTAADYEVDDYSPAGLRLHYDGLLNAGVGVARSTTATKWVNLGSDGAAMNLTLSRASTDNNRSAWGEQGYEFAGHAQFQSSAILWTTNNFTAQAFVDVALEDNEHESGNYIAATDWSRLGLQAYGYGDSARLNALGQNYMDPRPRFTPENGRLQYVTAIQNDSAKTTTIFPGVSAPTSGVATNGFRQYTSCSNEYSVAFRLGGWGGGAGSAQCLVGTVKNFRYYDRVLTEEELVRNRNVDSVRDFGELAVTNLVVAIEEGESMTTTPAPGAYFVEGSYDFSVQTHGSDNRFSYKLQRWDEENECWTYVCSGQGTEYTHVVADAPAPKMKLTWRRQQPLVLVVR